MQPSGLDSVLFIQDGTPGPIPPSSLTLFCLHQSGDTSRHLPGLGRVQWEKQTRTDKVALGTLNPEKPRGGGGLISQISLFPPLLFLPRRNHHSRPRRTATQPKPRRHRDADEYTGVCSHCANSWVTYTRYGHTPGDSEVAEITFHKRCSAERLSSSAQW